MQSTTNLPHSLSRQHASQIGNLKSKSHLNETKLHYLDTTWYQYRRTAWLFISSCASGEIVKCGLLLPGFH